MSVVSRLAALRGNLLWGSFQKSLAHPDQAQLSLLLRFLHANRDTAYGQRHGFARMASLADYRHGVPFGDYEVFRPWVDRMCEGEQSVLTTEKPYMFAMTSGTTGQPKLLPVTPSAKRAVGRLTSMWISGCLQDHPKVLDGKALVVVSPATEGYTPGGTPYGAASGYIYQHASWAIRRTYALPYPAFEIPDYDAKYYTIMRLAITQDISFVITPNPSTVIRLLNIADQRQEALIRDVRDGTIAQDIAIESGLRAQLHAKLRPDPRRAEELESIVADSGFLDPAGYWPRLALMGCWKGGSVGVALERLQDWLRPDMPYRDIGFLASEAQMTVPINDDDSGGVLAVNTNVYEFVPEDEMESSDPPVLTAGQLELGACYYVLLTTPSGLYRYDINDVIEVTGFLHKTPIIAFVRKGRDMVSLTGEKLHVGQVIAAVADAKQKTGVEVEYFRVVGNAQRNRYDLRIELGGTAPADEALVVFGRAMDHGLARLNIEYEQKRNSGRLNFPAVLVMASGWYGRRRAAKLAKGGRDTQFKDALLGLPDAEDQLESPIREIALGGEERD